MYSVTLLVAASSLMPIANAAEKLQTTLRVGTYFRAGHVPDGILKERRPLVLCVRETPLHIGHLRLMTQAAEIGAVIMPPVPAF
ncbi:hypothetical protein MJM04_35885, partial [Salmonella enterica subsp. enterica serovar Cerro]|nr:hypothetical protein [Salmonella enterica subsp. enterica serovar Cerro]